MDFTTNNGEPVDAALELLAIAATNNILFVQFGDNLPLHNLKQHDLATIKSFSSRYNIQVQAGTRKLTLQNVEQYINIAAYFKSPFLRIVIDDENYQPSTAEVIDILNRLLPLLKEKNIKLAIENHDRFKAIMLKNIIEKTDPKLVGICLDTANSLGAGEGISEVLHTLVPYVINLHIKDITIQRVSHKMGFTVQGVSAGDGIIDIPAIINHLNKINTCETATLELWVNPCNSIAETIQQEKLAAFKSIHYLKQFLS